MTRPPGRAWRAAAAFGPALGRALAAADLALVTDVYAAGEAPVPGAGPQQIVAAGAAAGGSLHHVPATQDLPRAIVEVARSGDILLVLGAGDITLQAPRVVAALEQAR